VLTHELDVLLMAVVAAVVAATQPSRNHGAFWYECNNLPGLEGPAPFFHEGEDLPNDVRHLLKWRQLRCAQHAGLQRKSDPGQCNDFRPEDRHFLEVNDIAQVGQYRRCEPLLGKRMDDRPAWVNDQGGPDAM
jgi:hypothetical protein